MSSVTSAPPTAPRRAGSRGSARSSRGGYRLRLAAGVVAVITIVIGVWAAVAASPNVPSTVLPSPWSVGKSIADLVGDQQAVDSFAKTLREFLLAFLIGGGIGLVVGIGLGLSRILRAAYFKPLLFVMSTPKVIFLPLFILIFGLTPTAVITFGAFECFFYVAVNVSGALGLLDDRYLLVGWAFNGGYFQRLVDIVIPATLPGIVAALWLGVKHALLGVIIAEFYASTGGVGFLVTTYTQVLRADNAFAVIVIISIFAIILGSCFSYIEHRLQKESHAGI